MNQIDLSFLSLSDANNDESSDKELMQPKSIKTNRNALDFNKVINQIQPSIDSLYSKQAWVYIGL